MSKPHQLKIIEGLEIAVLPDHDRDGVADRIMVFADGLDRPHGLAFSGDVLVAAENRRLVKLPDLDGDLKADREQRLSTDLPSGGGHWTHSLVIGTDGVYYISAGSSCNVCEEKDPRRAAALLIKKDGGPAEIYARGLRNSAGLARHPRTGELWASNNGRDRLGDDLPPEEINRIVAGGRPVAPAVGPDGALYLSDDRQGVVYRITAKE